MPTIDLKTHSTRDPYLTQIQSIIRRVVREGGLYLFGSRASNTPRVASDYDIGVRVEQAEIANLGHARELLEDSTIPFTVDLVDLGVASSTFVRHLERGSNTMEKFTDRLASAQRALGTLAEIVQMPKSVVVRDASIQRFEYTFESLWKLAKVYLEALEGVIANSPKQVFREALKTGLLTVAETETCLKMTDDRNLTAHTYLENIAEAIYSKLPVYLTVMEKLMASILERTARAKPGAETPTETAPKAD